MEIKIAMVLNGQTIEAGTMLNIIDEHGVKIKGQFIRAYQDTKIPNRMNIALKRVDREKVTINGTDAELIEVA